LIWQSMLGNACCVVPVGESWRRCVSGVHALERSRFTVGGICPLQTFCKGRLHWNSRAHRTCGPRGTDSASGTRTRFCTHVLLISRSHRRLSLACKPNHFIQRPARTLFHARVELLANVQCGLGPIPREASRTLCQIAVDNVSVPCTRTMMG
jgi:hypothetical protein